MLPGAVTRHIDVAQIAVFVFFLFFIALIIYLRREDRREGYPVVDPTDRGRPNRTATSPKTFRLLHGGTSTAPHYFPAPPMRSLQPMISTGNGLSPVGDPLLSAVGPSTYVMRSEEPLLDHSGDPQVQPLRAAREWSVVRGDADPRGMAVIDDKYQPVGSVTDIWVDRGVKILRYLEVALTAMDRTVLLPIYATEIRGIRRQVRVKGLLAHQFENVPALADPDKISMREEDQVNAYYAGGAFFNRNAGLTQ